MTKFKSPETATTYAGLDDAAFVDGQPVSAHVIRTLARQVNRALSRKALVYRWLGNGNANASNVATFVPPFWGHMTPCGEVPIFYAPGISTLRCRVRMMAEGATSGFHGIQLGYTTSRHPGGALDSGALTHTPNGISTTSYADLTIPVSIEGQDMLTLWWRAYLLGDEPLMNTTTHGGANTGDNSYNSRAGACIMRNTYSSPSTSWIVDPTNANAIQRNGHWIRMLSSYGYEVAKLEVRDGRADETEYVDYRRLLFQPVTDDHRWGPGKGVTWEIRQLPQVKLHSIAIYEDA